MSTCLTDPYASLSLRDRLELLAFEARLAGVPESLIMAVWDAIFWRPRIALANNRGVAPLSSCLITNQ